MKKQIQMHRLKVPSPVSRVGIAVLVVFAAGLWKS